MKSVLRKRVGAAASFAVSCSLVAFACTFVQPLAAQSGKMGAGLLQKKLADLKASTAENQQKLRQYTWTQTSQISMNGEVKKTEEFTCHYGPDGKVFKSPVGGQADSADSSRGGRFRQRVVAKKKAEMKDYMQDVGHVIQLYVPPDPAKMEKAIQARNVSLSRSAGLANIAFKDYALPGDSMTVGYDGQARKIRTLTVHTYVHSPQEPVTLTVNFATLPDGANYAQRTVLNAQAKNLTVVNTNSNYRKAGQ